MTDGTHEGARSSARSTRVPSAEYQDERHHSAPRCRGIISVRRRGAASGIIHPALDADEIKGVVLIKLKPGDVSYPNATLEETLMNVRIIFVLLVCALMMTGTIPVARTVQAQDDETPGVTGNSYTSPTWGYSLAWSDDWEVIASFAGQAAGGVTEELANGDYLLLSAGLPNGNSVSLEVMAGVGYAGDPDQCLDTYVAGIESLQEQESDEVKLEGFRPAQADGQPIGGHDDTSAYGVFEYAFIGEEFHWNLVDYVDCRAVTIDGDTVLLRLETSVLRENYTASVPLIENVLATLTLPVDTDPTSPVPLRTLPPLDPLPEQPSTPPAATPSPTA